MCAGYYPLSSFSSPINLHVVCGDGVHVWMFGWCTILSRGMVTMVDTPGYSGNPLSINYTCAVSWLNNCALSLLKADDLKIILLNYEILEPDTIPSHYQCAPVSGLMYILFQQVVPVNFGTLQGNKVSELLNIRLISWLAGA